MKDRPDPTQITHPLNVIRQAAIVGGVAAVPGTCFGAFYGTLRTKTPSLFAIGTGLQWFAIGTTFWGVRASVLDRHRILNWWNMTRGAPVVTRANLTPSTQDKVSASTISGAFTGASLAFLFRGARGYRNVIPGTIMFSLFGFCGQHAYQYLDKRNTEAVMKKVEAKEDVKVKENFLERISKSKWSPMTALTDEQYESMMNEKILKIEAEIALIDERIEGFRRNQKELERSQTKQPKLEQPQEKR
ncbi:hypothetical protein BDV95DRAFT_567846 [Massariosphaeria phaeospora]|uniref:Uncharacterized protein n=1 Tax=Massariosphaeria phaeospora TaxID=100035 RepID=A0A7C8MDB6_9PLEO|nr:hypothetical protein BDV95DRAFT_567846 [Massariosphaeria phaeospora]